MKKRTIVLTVMKSAPSYLTREFKPFVESLRNNGYKGEIVCFTNNLYKKTEKYFKSRGIKMIPYSFDFPYLKENKIILKKFQKFKNEKINIFHLREFLPYIYLLENKNKYDSVLIADTSDVVFQKNPFKQDFDRKKIYFSLLDNKIRDSPKDSEWIRDLYGEEELRKIWDKDICCTGTLIGGIKPMLNFLDLFINEFKGNTIEQGNLNYLIHNNKVKDAVVLNNQDGFLMTCSGAKKENFILGKDKKIRAKSGEAFTMIHGYDTFPQWSFLVRGICWRSIRETIKTIPFFGKLLIRFKALFVKSYVYLEKEEPPNIPSPNSPKTNL